MCLESHHPNEAERDRDNESRRILRMECSEGFFGEHIRQVDSAGFLCGQKLCGSVCLSVIMRFLQAVLVAFSLVVFAFAQLTPPPECGVSRHILRPEKLCSYSS